MQFFVWLFLRKKSYIDTFVGVLGVTGITFQNSLSGWTGTPKETTYGIGLLLLVAFVVLCSAGYALRNIRKAAHAEAMPHVREAVRNIAVATEQEGRPIGERRQLVSRAMGELSTAFGILTCASCRCCVKVLKQGKNPDSFDVSTYCRSVSENTNPVHPLEHNTDFNDLVLNPTMKWFFGNDLPGRIKRGDGYNNTNKDWQKSYRASVVWPIRKLLPDDQGGHYLLGFLCIDTMRKHAFSEEFDYPVGAVVADILGTFLSSVFEGTTAANRIAVDSRQPVLSPDGDGVASARLAISDGSPLRHAGAPIRAFEDSKGVTHDGN